MSELVARAAKIAAGCLTRRSKRYDLAKVHARGCIAAAPQPQDTWVTVHNVKSCNDGGILDLDDHLNDVVDDREQIIAVFEEQTSPCPTHNAGDGTSASSVGTESPDIFHCNELNHNGGIKGGSSYIDVEEITADKLPVGVAPLQVRRGSEPTLNRLSPVSSEPDPSKRWSAAVVVDDLSLTRDVKENGSLSDNEQQPPPPPGERGEGSGGEEKSNAGTLSRISRGSGRLSMLGNNPHMLRWAEAADRQLYKFQDSRKEPLGSAGSSPDRDSAASSGSSQEERDSIVVLKNEAGPLGIHVVPEQGSGGRDMGLVIQGIEPGGRIDRDGRLRVGDTIVEVNGRSLLHLSFQAAQQVFKEALQSQEICLHLSRRRPTHSGSSPMSSPPPPLPLSLPPSLSSTQSSSDAGFSSVTSSLQSPPKRPPPPPFRNDPVEGLNNGVINGLVEGEERSGLNSKVATVTPTKKLPPPPPSATANGRSTASSLNVANTRKIGRKVHIKLVKGPEGLGFSVTTRDNPAGGNCPIYIKNILPRGAAIDDGRLRPGDRLLEVNGVEMTGRSQTDAVTILRNAPPGSTVELVVSRQEPDPSPSPGLPREIPPEKAGDEVGIFPWRQKEILTLDIPLNDTGSAGLGVSVKGKTSTGASTPVDLGIFVKSVIHGGAASKDGRLRTNDQLLNINGISLLGMTNSQAMETLRRAMTQGEGPNPNAITLTIARRVPSQDVAENLRFEEGFLSSGDSFSVHLRSDSLLSSDSTAASSSCENLSVSGGSGRTPDHSTSGNSENTVVYVPKQPPPPPVHEYGFGRNPVLERLMGQSSGTLPSNLRNESYLRASHDSWVSERHSRHHTAPRTAPNHRPTPLSPSTGRVPPDTVQIEDDYPASLRGGDTSVPPMTPVEEEAPTPTLGHNSNNLNQSELSLVDGGNFCRDGFGRQSISEKRHAHLDARNTDTYKRNKRTREEQEKANARQQQTEVKTSISPPTVGIGSHRDGADPRRPTALNGKEQQNGNLMRSNSADSLLSHSKSHGATESTYLVKCQQVSKVHRNPLFFYPACCFMVNGDSPSTDASCHTTNTTVTKSNNSGSGNGTVQLVGPSLGMRKSSSLESLQTLMVQGPDGTVTASTSQNPRQERGARGCNESFRAAVDRSYDGPSAAGTQNSADQMETLEEEKESETGSATSAEHRGSCPLHSVTVPLDAREAAAYASKDAASSKPTQRKKGLLKGLGSVFSRFGKNRKTIPEPGSKLSREELEQEAERLRARQAARDEQERIQEQYRKLLEQQQQQQQQQEQQQRQQPSHQHMQPSHQPPLPPLPTQQQQQYQQNHHFQNQRGSVQHQQSPCSVSSPPPCPSRSTPTTTSAASRQERMQLLRAQHQKRHVERQGHYPRDDLEEWYEQDLQHKMLRSPVPPQGRPLPPVPHALPPPAYGTCGYAQRAIPKVLPLCPLTWDLSSLTVKRTCYTTQKRTQSLMYARCVYCNKPMANSYCMVCSPQRNTSFGRSFSLRTSRGLQRRESDVVHSRSQSFDIFKEMERPGSRVGLADPTQYSHYVNFNEIQLHLRQFQQKQQQQQQLLSQSRDPTCSSSSQPVPPPPMSNRSRSERPSSNYFEYETVQGTPSKPQKERIGMGPTESSSLPRHAHVAGHRMVYAKTVPTQQTMLPPHSSLGSGNGGVMIKTVPRAAPRAHIQTMAGYRNSPNHLSQVYGITSRHDIGQQMPGSKV
ncbi:par-3 family cell polarity regulator isoform X5 [Rhipicephalus microplus]|uniref:par-3 family cell polarity regulator isoform X5 n=1 Tax=Rhipicephalus microplus TaxID=6941 RepID=UPI003F6B85A0